MTERLFDIEEVPEVPLIRHPRGRGAQVEDERLDHDYPPDWDCCTTCGGDGVTKRPVAWSRFAGTEAVMHTEDVKCATCFGMGSVKGRVRLEAGHRCIRCGHPFMTKRDAKMLGVEPSPGHWSPCDERCTHGAPIRWRIRGQETWQTFYRERATTAEYLDANCEVEAEWKVLTVHHLDGDKANLRWWNLVSLCQRCHLLIQHKVVMDRVYPHPHAEWFRLYAAGYYAWVYLGQDLTRDETAGRLGELLALELDPGYAVTS